MKLEDLTRNPVIRTTHCKKLVEQVLKERWNREHQVLSQGGYHEVFLAQIILTKTYLDDSKKMCF